MIGARKMRLSAGGGYRSLVLGTQPTYFWPLQGATDLTDIVGGVTLTVDGTAYAEVQSGPFGDDLCWQTTGQVGLKDASAVINRSANTGSYSWGGWFYRVAAGGTNYHAFMSNYGGEMIYSTLSNGYAYHNGNLNYYTYLTNLVYSQWHHIIQTYDTADSKVRVYKDGILQYTSGAQTAITSSGTQFRIGGYATGNAKFYGGAAWCAFWVGKALSLSEVQKLAGV